jgi:hypothetical protein
LRRIKTRLDPSMTDEDEANIPPDSDADPNASQDAQK